MEIASRTTPRSKNTRPARSTFECDSTVIDEILGIRTLGNAHLRFDAGKSLDAGRNHSMQVHSPIEVVPVAELARVAVVDSQPTSAPVDENQLSALRRERMLRLLDQQQAWYDAAHEAARSAEQLLSLREHHQQQWLLSPNHPA